VDVQKLMANLDKEVKATLSTPVTVRDVEKFPDADDSRSGRTWKRMTDVVAVVADLKSSTMLGTGRHINTTLRLYKAATGNGVAVAEKFGPEFTDIQGDGFFSLFHGEGAYPRAIAAAMSLAYFSKEILEPHIRELLGKECPDTGLKVGVASGRLAVGPVGVRGATELVWPGKPVNWAFKCSGAADRHQVVVTEQVHERVILSNEYLLRQCYVIGHQHSSWQAGSMWTSIEVPALRGVPCFVRKIPWCPEVVDASCNAVLDGKTQHPATGFQRFRYFLAAL
jgi:class 3 adenylate cyclase